jgi:RNase P subunit RPR2
MDDLDYMLSRRRCRFCHQPEVYGNHAMFGSQKDTMVACTNCGKWQRWYRGARAVVCTFGPEGSTCRLVYGGAA